MDEESADSQIARLKKQIAILECPMRAAETRRVCIDVVTSYSLEVTAMLHKNTLVRVGDMQSALDHETTEKIAAEQLVVELTAWKKKASVDYLHLETTLATEQLKNTTNKKKCIEHVAMLEDEITELRARNSKLVETNDTDWLGWHNEV